MSKGSNTTTTTQTPTAEPQYQNAMNELATVGQNPYTPYGGEIVAGVNNQQQTGIGGINQNAYSAIPYLQGAESTIQGAAQPLTQGQIQNYQSPYTQDVINATMAQFQNSNAQQQQQVLGNAAAQGALGGDRTAVAQSVLAGQQQAQQAPVIAGLENTGYQQAVQLAMQQYQQNPEQAAYGEASTGTALENAGLTGANAQVGAGTLEQQTQQAQDTAALQQYMQTQFMPESMLSWELPLLTGVGSQEGGTSSTTGPPPNSTAQMAGLGIAGLGALGTAGGSAGIAGLAPLLACLNTGGGVSSRSRTIPESNKTLRVQQRQLMAGHRHAQMFPHGTKELELPRGMARTEADGGVFHHDPNRISAEDVKNLSAHGRENEMLGLGPYSKDEILHRLNGGESPIAVVERDPSGTEVRTALGTHTTARQIHAAMDAGKSPGHRVAIEHPYKVLAERMNGGRVQGLADGGVPGGAGFSPGLPVNPWLPSSQMPRGVGAPRPPQSPNQQQTQSAQQMVQNANSLTGAMKKAVGDTSNSNPAFGGGNALTDSFGGSSSSPLQGLDASDYGVGYRRGGRTPVRAGLGMASFMRRRGYDSGGVASDDGDVINFPSDRFVQPPVPAGLYNNSAGEANPLENILKFQTYGQNSPYAPTPSAAETPRTAANDELPPEITQGASAPQAGVGSAMAFAPGDTGPAPVAPAAGVGSRETGSSDTPDSVNAMHERADARKGLAGLSPDFYQSLMAAGLGMMASRSPFLGTAIGEGGLQGLGTYSGLKKQEQDVDLKVKQLNQAAKAEQDRIALDTKKESDTFSRMTPAQQAEVDFRNRNLERENLQPVKVGTDMSTGTDIYAVRDATAPGGFRRIDPASYGAPHGTPQGTGAPVSSAAPAPGDATTPAPSDDASLPAHSTPVSGDVPDNVKPEILAALDPNVASQVKALDEGRMAFPTGFALSKPYWQNMLRLVSQYDPSFDAVNYNARAKTRSDFVAGKSAQNITSFNTAIGHLDSLDNSIDALGNTRYGWLNPLIQSAKSATGDTQFQAAQKDFMAKKQAVTDELTRAFRGSGGNVHDIVGWENTLSQADSPAALHAATKAAIELLRSRIESVGDQYNRGMGTTRDPLTMLSPRAQAAVARLSGEAPATPSIDPRDAAALKANATNPAAAAAIDKKYGAGTAAKLLGAQ